MPMNKLILFPLTLMFILTAFAFIYNGDTLTSSISENEYNMSINGTNATVDIPIGDMYTFDIWGATGVMVILVAALFLGVLTGIRILGSGLSDYSQKLIFMSTVYLGLWAVLTVATSSYIFGGIFGTMFWLAITFMYVVGIASSATGDTGASG